jgi:hypothetical protein
MGGKVRFTYFRGASRNALFSITTIRFIAGGLPEGVRH